MGWGTEFIGKLTIPWGRKDIILNKDLYLHKETYSGKFHIEEELENIDKETRMNEDIILTRGLTPDADIEGLTVSEKNYNYINDIRMAIEDIKELTLHRFKLEQLQEYLDEGNVYENLYKRIKKQLEDEEECIKNSIALRFKGYEGDDDIYDTLGEGECMKYLNMEEALFHNYDVGNLRMIDLLKKTINDTEDI